MNDPLDEIALKTAHFLENNGFKSIYLPATYGKHAHIMQMVSGLFVPFPHKHAAVRAGLGEFGLNSLVISPQFGPRIRFISVITEAKLKPDPPLKEKTCLGVKCSLYIEECGTHCLSSSDDTDELEVWLNIPEKIKKDKCCHRAKKGGVLGKMHTGVSGGKVISSG